MTNNPIVGIIMGSDSDLSVMEKTFAVMREFDIPFEVKYGSDRIDDGIKKITDKIYEYILQKM